MVRNHLGLRGGLCHRRTVVVARTRGPPPYGWKVTLRWASFATRLVFSLAFLERSEWSRLHVLATSATNMSFLSAKPFESKTGSG